MTIAMAFMQLLTKPMNFSNHTSVIERREWELYPSIVVNDLISINILTILSSRCTTT